MARTYTRKAPAKLNLRLKVVGRRTDGYHELVSLMVPVDLCDILEFQVIPKGIEIAWEGLPVPVDEHNLVRRAAAAFFDKSGVSGGISVKVTKRIPVAAGMGGGSSDAAATLLSLNHLWSGPLSAELLKDLALRLGADVPFFLDPKPSIARGVGEILEPVEPWPEFWYLIVTPRFQVSTQWVYENLRLGLTSNEYDRIKTRLGQENLVISQFLENDLESVTSAKFPILDRIKKTLVDAGAEGALMTGSGPSVFGVFGSKRRAKQAKEQVLQCDFGTVLLATNWKGQIIKH
ncbi:MAG: 4-(cytidine 5'-diphospho)-2-C-methyl-D-erythritol kinase [Deltaproteobacteria bacterium]